MKSILTNHLSVATRRCIGVNPIRNLRLNAKFLILTPGSALFCLYVLLCPLATLNAQTYTLGTAPATNGATINTCSGIIRDPSAATGYGPNLDYTITICSNSSQPLTLSFDSYNIGPGDFLYVYDGPSTASPQFSGSPFSSGGFEFGPKVKTSTGTCITLRFTTNSLGGVNDVGWQANIFCATANAITACSGNFYDPGGVAGLTPNLNSTLTTICSDNGGQARVSFSSFNVDANYDFLYIYNGPTRSSPQIAGSPFTGTTSPGVVTGTGTCLTFHFVSDGSIQSAGWASTISCVGGCSPATVTAIPSCNGATYNVAGTVATTVSSGTLTISDGAASTVINLPQTSPIPYTLTGLTPGTGSHTVTATFSAASVCNGSTTYTAPAGCGPSADYVLNSGSNGTTVNTCTGKFADSGNLFAAYGNNEDNTITFCSNNNKQLTVTFNNFATQAGSDLLYIYNGPNTSSPQVPGSPFSGVGPAASPGVVSGSGTCLTFRFVSNGSTTNFGWDADISCSGNIPVAPTAPTWTGYPYTSCTPNTKIEGTVFEDFDNDGVKDAREPFLKGVEVKLYDNNGQVGAAALTDVNGLYSFTSLTAAAVYRVEFTIPTGFEEGAVGSGSGSAVQFVRAGTCNANLGVFDPGHYCGLANPKWTIPMYVNGSPTHSSNTGAVGVARFNYTSSGQSPNVDQENWVTFGTVGTTWGTAYRRSEQALYMASVLRRHTGLGPSGIGAIYKRLDSGNNTTAPVFYNFGAAAGVVATNATRFPGTGNAFGLEGACGLCDNLDPTVFGQIGKTGLGDIDLSGDEKTLYVTNLFDRKVYSINMDNPAAGSAAALPNQPWLSAASCNNGTARPWALKTYRGKLYVGVICDASTSTCSKTAACNDLTATVYAYNGSTWSTVITYPLNYYRKAYATGSNYWVKWMDNWSDFTANYANVTDAQFAQPILVDIEFDDDGSMIMGFGDRTAMQTGYQAPPPPGPLSSTAERTFAHGDMLRAYFNPNTQAFTLENNGVAGPLTTTNPASNVGPGGKAFYWGDFWYGAYNDANIGALAVLPGSGEVMHPVADPIDPYASGVVWSSSINGKANRKLETYQGSPTGNAPNFAKNGGLGDIELFCGNPPIEIGNYVWWDHNLNGRMDPSEPGIPNVTLRLYLDPDGNTTGNNPSNGDEVHVATTTSDNYGRYVFSFSGASNGLNAQTWQAGHTRVLAGTKYQVRINNFASDAGLTAYATSISSPSFIMTPTQNQGATGTQRDNNGYNNPGNAAAAVTTGNAGQHNHQFDFAFGPGGGCAVTAVPSANTPCVGGTLTLNANALGGTAPYTYSWSGPNSFTSASASPSIANVTTAADGNYTVTVTDAGGCVASFTIAVQVNNLTVTATTSPASCGMSTGSINLTVSNGITPYSFDWANNALDGIEDPTNVAAGNYPVTVTDAYGCSATATPSVGTSGGPSVTGVVIQPTCGLANGSINLTVTNGTSPYTFDWNVNALDGTEDPSGLVAGSYSVTVTDGASCVTSTSFVLVSSAGPSVTIASTNTTCGITNGSISLTVTGGTPAYTFDWNDNALDGIQNPTNLAAGTYTVTISDVNTCTVTTSAVIAPSTGFTASTTPVNETCSAANATITLTVTGGTAPYNYDWSNLPGTNNAQNQSGIGAGTYTVTVTDANNCTATAAATITNTAGPTTLTTTATNATACSAQNGAIDLQVLGGAIPYFYDWNNDGHPPPDYDTEDLTGLAPGTYVVTVTDNNGCTATATATVNIDASATITPTIVDPTNCTQTGSITLAVSGGTTPYTFDWNNIPGTSNPQNQTGLAAGTYIVTVTEGNGCTTVISMSIRDIREPVLNVTVTAPTCGGSNGAIDLTVAPGDGTGPFVIDWSNIAGSPNPEDQSGLPTGTYTVTVTDELSCSSVLVVNLSSNLAPSITLTTTNGTCNQNNGAIDMTITGGATPYNIDWDNIPGNTGEPEDQSNLAPGGYSVTVTDASGCTAIDVANITAVAATSSICTPTEESAPGANDGSVSLDVQEIGPFGFDWNDNALDGIQNPTNLTPGMYTVTVTDVNNCTATCVAEVQARLACTQTISSPSPAAQTLCQGATGANTTVATNETGDIRFVRFTSDQIAVNGSPTATELDAIYNGGTVLATVTPTGAGPYTATLPAATAGWSVLAPGTYYVYAILNPDQGAICRPVEEITVTIVASPVLSTSNAAVCNGQSIDLSTLVTGNTPAGTLSYHTSQANADAGTGALLNQVVSPTVLTTYYVRSVITSGSASCYDTAPIVVTVNAAPALTATNGSVCAGGSINLATLVTSSGGGTLTYYTTSADALAGTNALVVSTVSPASATNYYIRSTSSSDCFTVREVVVSIQASNCSNITVTGPN